MELRHIRYFVRAAELQHFTHAAESLYISQPSLSTHIHQLEEEFGLSLFDRIGRHVRLTEAGKIVLHHAVKALREQDLALERIAHLKGLLSGKLRIGSLLVFGQEMLPSWLSTFHSLYPKIQVDVRSGLADQVEAELLSGEIELGLSLTTHITSEFASEKLFSDQIVLVVSENHALAGRDLIGLDELSTIPLALVTKKILARARIASILEERGILLNIAVEVDDLQALLKIAQTSNMGTLLVKVPTANYPDLRLIPVDGLPPLNFGILWQAGAHLSPPARAFCEHVKGRYRERFDVPQR